MNAIRKKIWFVFMVSVITCVTMVACKRRTQTPSNVPALTWKDMLYRDSGVVLTGSCYKAEAAWTRLKCQLGRNNNDLREWLDFQKQILESTSNRPPESVCIMAAQEFCFYPWMYDSYKPWLKDCIDANLFENPLVLQKAKDTLLDMERGHTR
jgi:hypothetical protein